MRPGRLWLFPALILLAASTLAIGPRNVTSSGNPVKWLSIPVTVHFESDLDVSGRDVTSLVEEAVQTWSDLSESDVTLSSGSLGAAVDDGNICDYFFDTRSCPTGPTEDGTNPLVIDEDGSIAGDFFGTANKFTTLGFAAVVNYDSSTGGAVKGEAVFNAACLAGVMVAGCQTALGEDFAGFSDDDFVSFMVHELGHFLGLDHSQVNLVEAEDADASNDSLINTMFPTFIIGNGANFKTPNRDDAVGLAQLYPASGFSSGTWRISGTVLNADGTERQCGNVIARNAADAKGDAIAALSGDFAPSGEEEGSFEIPGLQPGASYALTVESIPSGYTGASGYTPCRSNPPQFTELTSSGSFMALAGQTVTVVCTIGGNCRQTGTGGGCSLLP